MKILSVTRWGQAIPGFSTIFSVGNIPDRKEIETPIIQGINFYETGCNSGRVYRGPCYVVSFADSNMKQVIPAANVIDVVYDTGAENKKAAKKPKKAVKAADDSIEMEMEADGD